MVNIFERNKATERAISSAKQIVRAIIATSPRKSVDAIREYNSRIDNELLREGVDYTPQEIRVNLILIRDLLLSLESSARSAQRNIAYLKFGAIWLLTGIFLCVLFIALKVGGAF
jgi:hypothetical protein